MGHEQSIEVVSMFLMGPREVLVIVIITAVIVYLRTRRQGQARRPSRHRDSRREKHKDG